MPRDYEAKINRNAMSVTITSGLSRQSSKISIIYPPCSLLLYGDLFLLGPNQANAEKPRGLQIKQQNTCV